MISESSLPSLNYDDVLLLPQHSDIHSRDDINLFIPLRDKFFIPVFSAPMKDISEPELVASLCNEFGIGVLHRFFDYPQERYENIDKLKSLTEIGFGISIGINEWADELEYVKYANIRGAEFVVIDTASGYLSKTIEATQLLFDFRKNNKLSFDIIVGNVVDQVGCHKLSRAGADIIRINIGSGAQCLTSKSIGIGCPALTSIQSCAGNKSIFPNVKLIADGGIYNPGDALKALCFGADGVMIGSLFGRAKEANNNGVIYGMSSYKLQERMNKTKKSNEGTVTIIPKDEIKPFQEIWNEFIYGLKSGLSYLGCNDINNLHDIDIEYIKINH